MNCPIILCVQQIRNMQFSSAYFLPAKIFILQLVIPLKARPEFFYILGTLLARSHDI